MNLIKVSDVVVGSFARVIGASGTYWMTAPLPAVDCSLSPYTLTEITLAKTLLPLTNEYGEALKVLRLIKHVLSETTEADVPSHSKDSCVNIDWSPY